MTRLRLAALVACALLALLAPRTSRACSGIPTCFGLELPRTGAVGVPLNAGVAIGSFGGSGDLRLEKDTEVVWSGGTPARFQWDPDNCLASYALPTLEANTTYVLKSAGAELTRFTTSEKAQASTGTAAAIKSLTVKVVTYPPEEVQDSMCTGCSTADIASVDFDPAVFPETAPGSVLYTWSLYPEGSTEAPPTGPMRFLAGATSLGCRGPIPCWLSPCASRSVGSRFCARVWAWGIPYAPDKAVVSDEFCTVAVSEVRPGRAGADAGTAAGRDAETAAGRDSGTAPGRDSGIAGSDASAAHSDAGGASADAGASGGSSGCSTAGAGDHCLLPLLLTLGFLRRRVA
ncbi:MAG TPA: hypothetical protein VGK67_10590 [Myxococcales bacterium]|jgi:hypothetical protein